MRKRKTKLMRLWLEFRKSHAENQSDEPPDGDANNTKSKNPSREDERMAIIRSRTVFHSPYSFHWAVPILCIVWI